VPGFKVNTGLNPAGAVVLVPEVTCLAYQEENTLEVERSTQNEGLGVPVQLIVAL